MNKPIKDQGHPLKKSLALGLAIVLVSACANTGVVVMEAPVEQLKNLQDFDRDGVIEAREKCADTVLGASIDNYGCGTQTSNDELQKLDIQFANDSYIIPSSAYAEIKELASFITANPELKVIIEGHTSQVGNREHNKTLSQQRAQAVVSMLSEDFNIAAERLDPIGYGFERPAETGDSEEAHAANRRIAAELSHTTQTDDMKWTIYTVDQVQ
jgi:OOP family OmpA-OmpF porin